MMTSQRKKPLPDQHPKAGPPARKVEAARKVEPAEPPQPQLEVLYEQMNRLATREQVDATTVQMNKLHGEAIWRINQVAATVDVLQERMGQMATREQLDQMATREQLDQMATKEQLAQMATKEQLGQVAAAVDVLQERMKQMATREEMHKLHDETMRRIDVLHERTSQMATREEMRELRGEFMERIGKVEICMGEVKSELRLIRWIGGALGVAIIAGLVRIIFFPVV